MCGPKTGAHPVRFETRLVDFKIGEGAIPKALAVLSVLWQPPLMTIFDQLDLMARGGALSLLALWIWLLVRDNWHYRPAKLAVCMVVAIGCYLMVTTGWYNQPSFFGLILALGVGATPGLFWLFTRAWFSDEQRTEPLMLLLVLLSVANTLVAQLTSPEHGLINVVSGIVFRISMLAFAGAALWEAWRGREGDLVEERRKIRPRLVATVGGYVILIAFAEIAAENGYIRHNSMHIVASSIVFIVLAFCAAMFVMRDTNLFGGVNAVAKTAPVKTAIDEMAVAKLQGFMESQMPHRDETLSIAKLAALLGEQEYRLRRMINGQLGYRNFAAFLNGYRLAEVKAALVDPTQKEVPIITIALDAGFGSLGPFNRAFREAEGMTPSEYRTRAV